jgi:hypothetical protein
MMIPNSVLAPLALLAACSDYDIYRPDKDAGDMIDTTTEPTRPEPDEPDIEVSPAEIDFGGWPTDCPADPLTVTITNVGEGELVVSDIALAGSGASAFMHDGEPPTLALGETYTFTVDFVPAGTFDYTVDLEVSSNDPDEAMVAVPTLGNGGMDATFEESFYQDFEEAVDIVWIIDNSGSMDEELALVKENFASFIEQFVTLDIDYHMGVITTDMMDPAQSGHLLGGTWITPTTPDPIEAFMALIDLGAQGSANEKAFAATEAAFSDPLVSGDNAGFLRDEAALSGIVLSDETDNSTRSSTSFASWFQSLKPDPTRVKFNAICGDPGLGCLEWLDLSTVLQAIGGDKYIEAAYATGGFWASICTSDYSAALEQSGLAAVGMVVSFVLTDTPSNVGLIVVTVDGATAPQDSSDGWTYDATSNALTFHGSWIPGAGAYVNVSYPVAGECPNQ